MAMYSGKGTPRLPYESLQLAWSGGVADRRGRRYGRRAVLSCPRSNPAGRPAQRDRAAGSGLPQGMQKLIWAQPLFEEEVDS
jgi:hypothetical protein